MNVTITGRKIDITSALKTRIQKKLGRLNRFDDNILDTSIILAVEKNRQIAEIKVNVNGATIWGKESSIDMYAAVDLVIDKIIRQLRKNRDKLKKRKKEPRKSVQDILIKQAPSEGKEEESFIRKIIPSNKYWIEPMFPDDAAFQLEESKENFVVFFNAENNKLNIIFKRKDGHYGLIDPE